jgi:hypothetical protein
MSDDAAVALLTEIRNWIRASSYVSIKSLLEAALPDEQSRSAYQMFDGIATAEQVRIAAKMGPNKLLALSQKWTSMGLMEVVADKKRKRLFDLKDFGLIDIEQ